MEEIEVMKVPNDVNELSTIKIEKSNNESQNLRDQEIESIANNNELNSNINENVESQEFNVLKDPEELNKTVTFEDGTYQPTFQMQPEIINFQSQLINDQQFVFGSGKINQDTEVKDPEIPVSDINTLDTNTQPQLPQIAVVEPKESETVDLINLEISKSEEVIKMEQNDTKEVVELTVDGKRICKCFSVNDDLDKQNDEPIEMKTAKSVDFKVIEEENSVPLMSSASLISTKVSDHNLRKVQNSDDLSNAESSTDLKSRSFIHSKELPVELQTKYPIQTNIIQVCSIPRIITRQYHTENLSGSKHSMKNESMSNAVIEDLNDDGYLNLPKIPSSTLSEASSSEWIDENISFVNSHDEKIAVESEPKSLPDTSKCEDMHVIPLESLCSILNEPQLSPLTQSDQQTFTLTNNNPQQVISDRQPSPAFTFDPQPSTSSNSEPLKKQKRFAGCKNFVRRFISNTLLRKKDRN